MFYSLVSHWDIREEVFFLLQASHLLRKLYIRHMVQKYVKGMTAQRKAQVILDLCHMFGIIIPTSSCTQPVKAQWCILCTLQYMVLAKIVL